MADKRYDQFTAGNPSPDRILLTADSATGALTKATVDTFNSFPSNVNPSTALQQKIGSIIINTAVNYDWLQYSSTSFFVSQRPMFIMIWLPACTVTGLTYFGAVSGAFTPNNFNGCALYSTDNTSIITQVAISNNSATPFTTGGALVNFPFTAPATIPAGVYYMSFMMNYSAKTQDPVYKTMGGHISELPNIIVRGFPCHFTLSPATSYPSTISLAGLSSLYPAYPCCAAYL